MNQPEFEYLGPYHVEKVIGRGGMGSVYKGTHTKSGEPVAIKVIAQAIANHARFRRRFATEVETLKRLKHPNIVQLIGYGEEQGFLFYSMEFVEGHSLHEHLRSHSKLPWEDVVQIGIETSQALKHAHNIGVIHRDLKPANIMLSKDGVVKLTDFGIAKLFGSTEETVAGTVIGTADFMPPEQAEGKPVTTRSDLYSLGAMLYALVCGKAPFTGKSVPEVLYAVRYSQPTYLGDRESNCPLALVELIHELLEKDPQKRPPTALVVSNRLKALQKGMEYLSRSDSQYDQEENAPKATVEESIGKNLTSLDLSDIEDDHLELSKETPKTRHSDPVAPTIDSNPRLGTHEQATLEASDSLARKPLSSEFSIAERSSVAQSRDRSSIRSSPSSGMLSDEMTSGGPSHYTAVTDEEQADSFVFRREKPADSKSIDWVHYGSIAGIVSLLIGSVFFMVWMLQPPSSNEMYAEIIAAVDSGDDSQFLAAHSKMEEFIGRFPEDERIDEVRLVADEADLIRRTRLLQRKASRSGGIDELTAIEQAFLDCMQTRSQNADLARQKLDAFTAVFGAVEQLSANEQRLLALAEFAKQLGEDLKLEKEPIAKIELASLVDSAVDALKGDAKLNYLNNLRFLYDDKPWAKEQMKRIDLILEASLKTEPESSEVEAPSDGPTE